MTTGAILLQGQNKDGVYEWPNSFFSKSSSPLSCVTIKPSSSIWHQRLGHPSTEVLNNLLRFLHLSIFGSLVPPSCESCLYNKIHRPPFGESTLKSSSPLELVYSDVWGPAPVTSLDGYKYYVIFVDHFTKYIWLFPLQFKYDVFGTFVQFKNNVENYFKTNIVSVYTDGGGEFIKLKEFFLKCGISHLYTPPYTPQHHGTAERRHQHIVETGITLLHQASLPPKFWSFAF